MKILQIFSNWKWTGPAEHALNLALCLKKSGHDVSFACARPPEGQAESIAACAEQAGILPVTRFKLNKHFRISDNLRDVFSLRRFIKKENFDLVHTHLPNDHFLAGMALRTSFAKAALVRTSYDGHQTKGGFKTRLLFSCMTDGLIVSSERTKTHILSKHYLPDSKIWTIDVPIDLERFDPLKVKSNRAKYKLSEASIVGGIVARVQTHRRFEVLLEALQIVLNEFPGFRFMIIGRGTHIQEVAVKPSQEMGIRTNLIFTGYKKEDFTETLACLNFKVFLVPGSDGSCRAVREAMAMGIPIIVANRGMLPEIVEHKKDGLVINDTPENLARAIMLFVEHPELRQEMGQNAYNKSRERFDPVQQTKKIEAVYEKVLSTKRK
jgi:glycosyltransferase involved in cell wall biosynthesis